MKIFCLIPAFNEKGNLQELAEKLAIEFHKHQLPFKMLFIIQGNDGSRELLDKLQKKIPQINYLYYPEPLGIGQAYRIGFSRIDNNYTHVLTLDADLNHEPKEISKFLKAESYGHFDVIIGSRFIEGGRFKDSRAWKRFTSALVNKVVAFLSGIHIRDISSGFRLINKEVITKIHENLRETGYPAYMEFILRAQRSGFTFSEVSITYIPRKWGKSKMGKLSTLKDYLLFLPKIFFIF